MTLAEAAAEEIRAAMFAQADEMFSREPILPGDITKQEWAQHWGISENASLDRMKKMAKNDPSLVVLTVWDPEKQHKVIVTRKT